MYALPEVTQALAPNVVINGLGSVVIRLSDDPAVRPAGVSSVAGGSDGNTLTVQTSESEQTSAVPASGMNLHLCCFSS